MQRAYRRSPSRLGAPRIGHSRLGLPLRQARPGRRRTSEKFKLAAGIDVVHVPHNGGPNATTMTWVEFVGFGKSEVEDTARVAKAAGIKLK